MMISATELFVRRFDELAAAMRPRDEFEAMRIGAILRQLLLDEQPLMIRANEGPRLRLRFEVNQLSGIDAVPVKPQYLFRAHGLDPAVFKAPSGTRVLRLEQFLAEPIIETPTSKFTIRQIVKYAANKAGGVHFDPTREPEEAELEQALDQIRAVGVQGFGLALVTIGTLVLRTLAPLRETLVRLPNLPLMAHYKVPAGSNIFFERTGQFLQTPLHQEIVDGVSWNAIVRVVDQGADTSVLYELGRTDAAFPRLSLFLDPTGALTAEAQLDATAVVRAVARGFKDSPLWNRYCYIAVDLCYRADGAAVSLLLNNALVEAANAVGQFASRGVTMQVLGADLNGRNSAALYIRELVIATRCLSDQERAELGQYFWLEWHD